MKKLSILIYVLIGMIHVYMVKEIELLVYLIVIFEIVRLKAVKLEAKLPIILLGIFSAMLISVNYYNVYEKKSRKEHSR